MIYEAIPIYARLLIELCSTRHAIFNHSNFGKLNYYLGAGALNDGRPSRYPEVDFCKLCFSSLCSQDWPSFLLSHTHYFL